MAIYETSKPQMNVLHDDKKPTKPIRYGVHRREDFEPEAIKYAARRNRCERTMDSPEPDSDYLREAHESALTFARRRNAGFRK